MVDFKVKSTFQYHVAASNLVTMISPLEFLPAYPPHHLLMTRALQIAACLFLVCLSPLSAYAERELTIGSPAPALDIEHWLQDGNGFFKHVTTFKPGKVYVVEFWATWCGPCIMSMPHLAELQNKFRGRGVQIISVSDESVDEVNALLSQQHPQANRSFSEISSAYSLTADPDRSTHVDYMDAAKQDGIPTSFIVGKTGKIEWIGHPAELDAPLEAVVTDQWDRDKFKKNFQSQAEFKVAMQKLAMLAGAGKYDQAIELAEGEMKRAKDDDLTAMVAQWTDIRFDLMLSAGKIDQAGIEYYQAFITKIKDDPIALGRFGYSLYSTAQEGGKLGPLAGDVIKAIDNVQATAPADVAPFLHNTVAHLYVVENKIQKAIEAQQLAVDKADDRQKRRLIPFLDQLKSQLGEDSSEESDETEATDK